MKVTCTLLVAATVALVAAGVASTAVPPKQLVTVGPGFTISLKQAMVCVFVPVNPTPVTTPLDPRRAQRRPTIRQRTHSAWLARPWLLPRVPIPSRNR